MSAPPCYWLRNWIENKCTFIFPCDTAISNVTVLLTLTTGKENELHTHFGISFKLGKMIMLTTWLNLDLNIF